MLRPSGLLGLNRLMYPLRMTLVLNFVNMMSQNQTIRLNMMQTLGIDHIRNLFLNQFDVIRLIFNINPRLIIRGFLDS